MAFGFNPQVWLARYEAAGGRFAIIGKGALTIAPWPSGRAADLEAQLLRKRRNWVAVYQLAAARG